jgi:2-aminoadipate transaminase
LTLWGGVSVISRLSRRVPDLQASPIREILSVIDRPGMVSFAGGLPAPDSFPELATSVPAAYLQYGATEGEPELRAMLAEQLNALGLRCTAEQILVLSGSQQGLDLVAKLFIDQGTPVAVESPTYLAALQVFRFFGAQLQPFAPQSLRAMVSAGELPALLYAIPTFQNPTGYCYSSAERAEVAAVCDAHDIPLFEDDPYRDLAYELCDRQPICAQVQRASWIYQGSFSKSLAPGLRLGFLAASPDLIPYIGRLKQAADLHSSRISQFLVLDQLKKPDRVARLQQLAADYRDKRDRFGALLTRYFGDLATWQMPAGGLFFWLQLHRLVDTRQLLPTAIEQGVAFMPGEAFYPQSPLASGTLRLNFSHASIEAAEHGLAKLANIVRNAA